MFCPSQHASQAEAREGSTGVSGQWEGLRTQCEEIRWGVNEGKGEVLLKASHVLQKCLSAGGAMYIERKQGRQSSTVPC